MARPRSEDKRIAIMEAATRVIVAQGLGAPTALIAQEAGVATGTLFTYFETKAELYNQLYLELKTGMAAASLDGLPTDAGPREQLFHIWSGGMKWAAGGPGRRRALAMLAVSEEITAVTVTAGHKIMAPIAELLERIRANGPLRGASMAFVSALLSSISDATMDFMIRDPRNADKHSKLGFEALWRALG